MVYGSIYIYIYTNLSIYISNISLLLQMFRLFVTNAMPKMRQADLSPILQIIYSYPKMHGLQQSMHQKEQVDLSNKYKNASTKVVRIKNTNILSKIQSVCINANIDNLLKTTDGFWFWPCAWLGHRGCWLVDRYC